MIDKILGFNKKAQIKRSSLKERQAFLDNFYKFDDKSTVIEFIEKNKDLVFVLQSLPKLLIQFFENAKLSLEIASNEEYNEENEENQTTLFLGICTPLSYQEAFNKKRELFKNAEFKEIMKHKGVKNLLSIGIENY